MDRMTKSHNVPKVCQLLYFEIYFLNLLHITIRSFHPLTDKQRFSTFVLISRFWNRPVPLKPSWLSPILNSLWELCSVFKSTVSLWLNCEEVSVRVIPVRQASAERTHHRSRPEIWHLAGCASWRSWTPRPPSWRSSWADLQWRQEEAQLTAWRDKETGCGGDAGPHLVGLCGRPCCWSQLQNRPPETLGQRTKQWIRTQHRGAQELPLREINTLHPP